MRQFKSKMLDATKNVVNGNEFFSCNSIERTLGQDIKFVYQDFYGFIGGGSFLIALQENKTIYDYPLKLERSLLMLLFAEVYGTKNCPLKGEK